MSPLRPLWAPLAPGAFPILPRLVSRQARLLKEPFKPPWLLEAPRVLPPKGPLTPRPDLASPSRLRGTAAPKAAKWLLGLPRQKE